MGPVRRGSKTQGLWPRAPSWPGGPQFLPSSHIPGAASSSHTAKFRQEQGLPLHYEFNGSWEPGAADRTVLLAGEHDRI